MFRFPGFRIGLLCLAVSAFAGASLAQSKIAVINTQKAMSDADELKKASAAAEVRFKPRQDEITKLQADLQNIETQLNSGKVSQEQGQSLQAEGQRKQRDLQRKSDDLQQDFERERQDILSKAAQKMQTVITKLAEEKGVDLVVDASQTLYFKPALDLTNDAVAAYNKAYPAR